LIFDEISIAPGITKEDHLPLLEAHRRNSSWNSSLMSFGIVYTKKEYMDAVKVGMSHLRHGENHQKKFGENDTKSKFYDRERINKDYAEHKVFLRGFIALPRLRQWLEEDIRTGQKFLFRESHDRLASSTELFYDLIFVAVISKLTYSLAHDPSHWLSFIVLYYTLRYGVFG